jgi:Recombination endonuclease VII
MKVGKIEIKFPLPVELNDSENQTLQKLVDEVYRRTANLECIDDKESITLDHEQFAIKRMEGETDKEWHNRYQKEWAKANPDRYRKTVYKWQHGNREVLNIKRSIRVSKITAPTRPRPGFCEICGEAETNKHQRTGTLFLLALDHSHRTGKFRGWICFRCNTIAGKAKDDPEILEKIARYLRSHE